MHLIKIFIMTLKRFYVSSLLNIIGLAVAFATAYLIMVQVNYDFTFNQSLPDTEHVFILEGKLNPESDKYQPWICRPLADEVLKDNPAVECYGIVIPNTYYAMPVMVQKGGELHKHSLNVTRTDVGGLDILQMKALKGDLTKFSEPNTIILSESAAKRIGADIDNRINFKNPWGAFEITLNVVAIYPDFPENCDFKNFEAIFDFRDYCKDGFSSWSFNYLVKLYSPDDADSCLESAKNRYLESNVAKMIKDYISSVRLTPISETYFSTDSTTGTKGNITTTYTLLAIAILVIVIAFINFINFFMAMVPQRLHGVNTYRIYGCSLSQMRMNFIFESIGLTVMALGLSMLIIVMANDSAITEFISTSILIKDNIKLFLLIAGCGLIFALVAVIYPACYITSFPPIMATKGRFSATKSGKRMRYILVGIQFVISISLITCSIFVKLQHDYMMRYDMGFNKEMVIAGEVPDDINLKFDDREALTSELKKNHSILDVTYSEEKLVLPERMSWTRGFRNENINFECYPVAYNFLDFMKIDLVEGDDFSIADESNPSGVFIFNEYARDKYGLTLDDKIIGHAEPTKIAGFCKDFNYKPLQYSLSPFAFYVFGPNQWESKSLNHLYIRLDENADVDDAIKFVKDEIVKYSPIISRDDLNFEFFDEELGRQYYQEKKLTTLITLFSIVSIIISLMGVFGLVLFETQYSRKEIAIRRVNGATVKEILRIFNTHFVIIIIICFIISTPICYFIVEKWLESFVCRTPVYWWVFALALLLVMTVTIGIVIVRSWRAANENPIESLKKE